MPRNMCVFILRIITENGTIFRKIEGYILYIYIYCYWIEGKREGERERSISFCNSNYLHLRYHTRSVYHFSCLRTIRQMYDTSLDN